MAVQKSRVTKSKKGMRRSHQLLSTKTLSVDKFSGEIHLRHYLTKDGYYRGRKFLKKN